MNVKGRPTPRVYSTHLKCFEVVDKDVWEPEVVDQLQVDGKHGV